MVQAHFEIMFMIMKCASGILVPILTGVGFLTPSCSFENPTLKQSMVEAGIYTNALFIVIYQLFYYLAITNYCNPLFL